MGAGDVDRYNLTTDTPASVRPTRERRGARGPRARRRRWLAGPPRSPGWRRRWRRWRAAACSSPRARIAGRGYAGRRFATAWARRRWAPRPPPAGPTSRRSSTSAGELTYSELDRRGRALAPASTTGRATAGDRLALMCRNHRGFVQGLLAGSRLGADVLLLNTDFAGPQLAAVLEREALRPRRSSTRSSARSSTRPASRVRGCSPGPMATVRAHCRRRSMPMSGRPRATSPPAPRGGSSS